MLNAYTSRHRGGGILTHHEVVEIIQEKGQCVGIKARERLTSQIKEIRARIIINAAGAWGDKIARLGGTTVPMTLSKGSLIIIEPPAHQHGHQQAPSAFGR
ncbi:MAG: FAD-dependent oxidoreductase [Desulfomicrobium escambiense]|nr:FAD-dependent oxidoreductase [Desulfomicrobium escambiense]